MPVALVTGANKGIGYSTAAGLARRGFTVWLGARNQTRGEAAAASLRALGLDARFIELDVTNEESIDRAVEVIGTNTSALDTLVNNAGISTEGANFEFTPPSQLGLSRIRDAFEVNLFGAIAVTQKFLPLLRRSAAPRIVNVSSELGSMILNTSDGNSLGHIEPLAYKTSKAALNMATVMFARELRADGFKVNAATPGLVASDLSGKGNADVLRGRPGFKTPDDGARIIVDLATLPSHGPTGGFFRDGLQTVPW
ncbi:SDR family oxidoreductase [Paraburkholderia hospita]|uniref:SDR family oxidoreductase n=1 Tax=Paraburkholderia hospita TaxID=169430 RepID=UPI0009A6DC69|nr:SDR family oxidoreductase [Paraburkholderia hospita]SKC69890.1 Short-chain dehydrogenase [Paraburkholderia hospita]